MTCRSGPLISRIRRLSSDDGPGLRDVVFFKGCRFTCIWCHNPEAVDANVSILYFGDRCVNCNACREICPSGAAVAAEHRIDRNRCLRCGQCASICPARALEAVGKEYTPESLVALLARDSLYFENSGGGVTFSGGEPCLHLGFLSAAANLLKQRSISVAIETSGDFGWAQFEREVLPHLDIVLFDLKLMESGLHRRYTGQTNEHILHNFARLAASQAVKLVPRTPLIPGVTDTPDNLERIAGFLSGLGVKDWVKLRFNPSFVRKRRYLGLGCTEWPWPQVAVSRR